MENIEETTPPASETYFDGSEQEIIADAIINEEEAQQEEQLPELDFAGLDKPALLEHLEETLKSEDVQAITGKVKLIRQAYSDFMKKESESKLNAYLEDGGEKEDFELRKDAISEKFENLITGFEKKKKDLKVQKEKQLIENTAAKKAIIEELKELLASEDFISKKFLRFQALQARWRAIGGVIPAQANNLWQNYQFNVSQFFDIMKISKELRELDMKKNLELKAELCEKAEKLADVSSVKKAIEELRNLQEKWKEIGWASKEAGEEVWQRFKAAADKVYERFKENLEKTKAQQQENLKEKIALCDKLDEINAGSYTSHTQWQQAMGKVNEIWAEWQKIGYAPKEDKNATWNRFKTARQKFFDLKDVYYNSLKEEWSKNLAAKTALCEQAESLQTSTDWAATTNAYKKLQADWKKTGPVSRKHSDKIWNRFKKACDIYFENKAKHYADQDAALMVNYNQKMEVVEKIKNLEVNEDNRVNLEALKKLQEDFRAIGEVPYKMFETLATSYRKTVDEYFSKIKEKKGADEKSFHTMKYEQMQQSAQGKEELQKERTKLQEKIKNLQAEVNQLENNLSFFGKSNKTDELKVEYEKKLVKDKEEIKKLKEHLKLIPHN